MSRQGRPHGSSDGPRRAGERARSLLPLLHLYLTTATRARAHAQALAHGTASDRGRRLPARTQEARAGGHGGHRADAAAAAALSLMILPQVHLRKPCYDFYFL